MVIVLAIILLIIFFYLTKKSKKIKRSIPKKVKQKKKKLNINDLFIIKYKNRVNNYKKYLKLNHTTKGLYISRKIDDYSIFKLIPNKKNVLSLESTKNKMLVNILYTIFYRDQYDILVSGTNCINNTCKLKLNKSKYKGYFYIKFYNGYYLSIDKNIGILYASKHKENIFNFKFIPITKKM